MYSGSPAPIPITYSAGVSASPEMAVLILGGTAEARELAAALEADGVEHTLALRRTTGGFGGPEGLRRYVAANGITAIVDATHPFATRISASALQAGVPLVRLERPPFAPRPGRPHVDSLAEAELPADARVFLTTGHQ